MKVRLVSTLSLYLFACNAASFDIEPHFEGCATDESWVTFDDYLRNDRVNEDAAAAPKWLEPQTGSTLNGDEPTVFRFQPSAAVAGSKEGDATCPQLAASRAGSLSPRHLPPVSGTVYDLTFALGGHAVYRVLTTRQAVGVPKNLWQAWRGQRMTATLYGARLLRNEVAVGPYRATPLELLIAP